MSVCYKKSLDRKKRELSVEQQKQITEAFELFDADSDYSIDSSELRLVMRALGFEAKKEEICSIMARYGNSGRLKFKEFNLIMSEKMLSIDPREEMAEAFRLFDDDATGKINLRNLRRISRELGEELKEEDLKAMIAEFDVDQDGEINMEEFLAIMLGNKT